MLGNPYTVSGEVLHGAHLGNTLGFPTINLLPPAEKLLPPYGVYCSNVRVEEKTYRGLTNIGVKPTVGDTHPVGVETYLYDFEGDLYGKKAYVALNAFVRPEKKFSSVEELKAQLQKDIALQAP